MQLDYVYTVTGPVFTVPGLYLPKATQAVHELTGFGLVPVLPPPAAMLLIVVTF